MLLNNEGSLPTKNKRIFEVVEDCFLEKQGKIFGAMILMF